MEKQDKKWAFTLAEVLVTLAIIGVVAALTIPTVIKNYKERQTVTQVKKFYRNFASIVQQWQVDEGCTSNVKNCIARFGGYDCKNTFGEIENKLKVIKHRYQDETFGNIDWLPDTSKLLNGNAQDSNWQGVSKFDYQRYITCNYLLSDGSTLMLHADSYKESGLALFDVNGKKEPNMLGKDIFPIGIGAYNNPKYPSVNPYYSEDNSRTTGCCNVGQGQNCAETIDNCTKTSCSPTAYILKNDKLPPITW